ncbi:unnamed protein product, partial [Didymodactylos carnosus]
MGSRFSSSSSTNQPVDGTVAYPGYEQPLQTSNQMMRMMEPTRRISRAPTVYAGHTGADVNIPYGTNMNPSSGSGHSSVGKSNLLLRFTRNEFRLDTQSTIGVEFAYKQLNMGGKKIKTQVWDTAGQERFKTVIPQFYRGSEGALCVFDLTKPDSFDHIV